MNEIIQDTISFIHTACLNQYNPVSNKDSYEEVHKHVSKFYDSVMENVDYDNIQTRLPWQVLMASTKNILTAFNVKTEGLDGRDIITKCIIEHPKLFNELTWRTFYIIKSYL